MGARTKLCDGEAAAVVTDLTGPRLLAEDGVFAPATMQRARAVCVRVCLCAGVTNRR